MPSALREQIESESHDIEDLMSRMSVFMPITFQHNVLNILTLNSAEFEIILQQSKTLFLIRLEMQVKATRLPLKATVM